MKPLVPFLDLGLVNETFQPSLELAAHRVIRSGQYILGPEVSEFEKEFATYCGVKHCVTTGSGFSALQLMMEACGFGPGIEVLVPAHTFIATHLAIARTGATPVLLEPSLSTYTLDPKNIETNINARTKAIVAVHMYGQCADMAALRELAYGHHLLLIEDCAQAHGAEDQGKKAGALALAGAFSFYPAKNLGALGDGGAVTTNSENLAETVRTLRNYGSQLKHEYSARGINSRLDEIQAAILREKLPRLDADNTRRDRIARQYLEGISHPGITLPSPRPGSRHVWHLFVIRTPVREALQKHLSDAGIETAIHYPIPPHRQGAFPEWAGLDLPITEQIHREVLSLPLHPALSEEQVEQVIVALNAFPAEA